MELTVYIKGCCPLCDDAVDVVRQVQQEIDFDLLLVDIESDPDLFERYKHLIPVVTMGGEELFYGKVSAHRLREILRAAHRRLITKDTPLISQRYRTYLLRLRKMLRDRHSSP